MTELPIILPGRTAPPKPPHDVRDSFKERRRYRGKMVGPGGSPRSQGGSKLSGGRPPFFEVGAGDQPSQSCGKAGKGRRVSMPRQLARYMGEFTSW